MAENDEKTAEKSVAGNDEKPADKQLAIQKVYVKDFSFESPQAPQVFSKTDWAPKTDLNLRSAHTGIGENNHEVVLTITVEAKEEDQTIFLVELHQAGIFLITGYAESEMKALVGSFCPNILFPYAREAIAAVISKGGFPEFLLQPINFDALYAQGIAQAAAKAAEGTDGNNGETSH
ncbi:MAG: protein-export chaperone SecB [Woeseia sp.]|jgi:preprotein translocase subunit SecB|nr:protein-export chaperone SecB [Woeseia sp.]